MWPFSKSETRPEGWLTVSQARKVTKVFYRDHDVNCWYACAQWPNDDGIRIATASKADALRIANDLVAEVFLKSGRRLEAREE
jgi:hypothetical protein